MVAFMSWRELLRPCCSAWWICAASCNSIICNRISESYSIACVKQIDTMTTVTNEKEKEAKKEVNKSELVVEEERG
jgi:hypothetical protein